MGRSGENKPMNAQGPRMACPRYPQQKTNHRRALSSINQNILGAAHVSHVVRKRGFPEKDVMVEKNAPAPPIDRPITRRFAAELTSSNHQSFPKDKGSTYMSLTATEHSPIVKMEDCKDSSDPEPIPMFVKHTEAMMDEVDRMVEVEMEDVDDDRHILDIDSGDLKNHLAVTEYVEDIYDHYRRTEISARVSPHYMTRQHDINQKMRAILIDWLIEVHEKFELMEETLFLTVNIIDRFLECETVVRKKLQLVGVTALLLACKYEEVSVVSVEDLVVISDKAYTRAEVLHMEKLMVNKLQFNMSVPTPYVFMRRFLKAAQSDQRLAWLSFFIVELSLLEYEMLKFAPSLLAAAAVFTALCTLHGSKQWTKSIEWHTNYSEDQLMDCSKMMVTYHQKAGKGKLTGVYKKYSSSRFGCTAKFKPAGFLLDDDK